MRCISVIALTLGLLVGTTGPVGADATTDCAAEVCGQILRVCRTVRRPCIEPPCHRAPEPRLPCAPELCVDAPPHREVVPCFPCAEEICPEPVCHRPALVLHPVEDCE